MLSSSSLLLLLVVVNVGAIVVVVVVVVVFVVFSCCRRRNRYYMSSLLLLLLSFLVVCRHRCVSRGRSCSCLATARSGPARSGQSAPSVPGRPGSVVSPAVIISARRNCVRVGLIASVILFLPNPRRPLGVTSRNLRPRRTAPGRTAQRDGGGDGLDRERLGGRPAFQERNAYISNTYLFLPHRRSSGHSFVGLGRCVVVVSRSFARSGRPLPSGAEQASYIRLSVRKSDTIKRTPPKIHIRNSRDVLAHAMSTGRLSRSTPLSHCPPPPPSTAITLQCCDCHPRKSSSRSYYYIIILY